MSMNELPVPSGSWTEHYNAKQRSYNLHLLLGVAFTVATVFVVSRFNTYIKDIFKIVVALMSIKRQEKEKLVRYLCLIKVSYLQI